VATNTLDEERILKELAAYDNRKLLLWQLAANGRDFCGVRDAAREHGLEDESVAVQVAAFVDDMLRDDLIRDRYDSGTDWDALEEAHGDLADQYCQ
jgi:hypothetical protein